MTVTYIHDCTAGPQRRLLLIFGGWGSDASVASGLERADYDIAVVWNYRGEASAEDVRRIGSYGEVMVIAWSYGVAAAALFINAHPEVAFTLKIAVNGTHTPVDSATGIAPEIFRGTLEGMSERTLEKFRRRMCGSAAAYAEYMAACHPQRSIESLCEELKWLGDISAREVPATIWDVVYISASDRIIPTQSQRTAWRGHGNVRETEGFHKPDFRAIIEACIVDKHYLSNRFGSAQSTYEAQASVQRSVAQRLGKLIEAHRSACGGAIIEAGCGSGMLTREIAGMAADGPLTLWDLAPIPQELPGTHVRCDAEMAIRGVKPGSVSMIASASTVQWFDSPALFTERCARALRPGGLLAIATYGPGTFASVRPYIQGCQPRYHSEEWWRATLEKRYDIAEMHSEKITLHFDSSMELARHMSRTGVNASTPSASALRRLLRDNVRTLDYEPIYIVGIAKPESN